MPTGVISEIDNDLLRIPVASDAISDNVKNAPRRKMRTKLCGVAQGGSAGDLGSVVGVGSSSRGSTLTQQLIKQQVVGDAPTFKRKAVGIVDALALERCLG